MNNKKERPLCHSFLFCQNSPHIQLIKCLPSAIYLNKQISRQITVPFIHCKSWIEGQVQGLRNCKTPEHTLVCEDFYNEHNEELALLCQLLHLHATTHLYNLPTNIARQITSKEHANICNILRCTTPS